MLIKASICIGDFQKAYEVMKELNYAQWDKYNMTKKFDSIFHEHGWLAVQEEVIKLYEEVGANSNLREKREQAMRYITVKKYNKAIDYFEEAYEMHSPNLPLISDNSIFIKLKDNPRYIELLRKMNMPIN
jgi:tetratricopeptide (TPR) repeat protein